MDHVYEVAHFVRPGETLPAFAYQIFPGGKGLNQSFALSKCDVSVSHAGKIGTDGEWLKGKLHERGVDTSLIRMSTKPTGHAVIQVTPSGENAIIIYGGANQDMDDDLIDDVFSALNPGDYLLLQNEIMGIGDILRRSGGHDLKVVLNPAPMTTDVFLYPLEYVDILILNQVEATEITGRETPDTILKALREKCPGTTIVFTMGEKGVLYSNGETVLQVPARSVSAVDTTGAGDTFIGYFLGDLMNGKAVDRALETACSAAALCVTRQGAASSIPEYDEVVHFK